MSLEYAQDGLIGLMTPQANTTVEPEMGILLPPRMGMISARLTSPSPGVLFAGAFFKTPQETV